MGCWLRAIGVGRYESIFEANEITGSVLLDVGLDDLDYMKIEVLGHRKVIMREIEKLRRGKSTVDITQAPQRSGGDGEGSDNTSPQQQQRMDDATAEAAAREALIAELRDQERRLRAQLELEERERTLREEIERVEREIAAAKS